MCSPASDVHSLSDVELGSHLNELERSARAIEAERARCLAEVERRGMHARDGHLSAATWLAHRHGISQGAAAAQVRVARSLEQMPGTAGALAAGEISSVAVDAMVRAREGAPERFARSEKALVEQARLLTHRDLRAALDHWQDAAQAAREEDERHARRAFTAVVAPDGLVRTGGELDPENGQYLITALRAKVDVWARQETSDTRTPAQRRADALGEICREWLDVAERPALGGERPHVVVTMDLAALEARAGGRAWLEDAGTITPELARRLACDAHHVRHWADGGETGLSNLVLLCRPHHRLIHRGFGVAMVDGRPEFRRPNGTRLAHRGPPVRVVA